jgi:hypothetical protein
MQAADLATLLDERKSMRQHCRAFSQAMIVPHWPQVKEAENAIHSLVVDGLVLQPGEAPGKSELALLCSLAVVGYDTFELLETPRFMFSKLGGRVYTASYLPTLKARILTLCGPLDAVLELTKEEVA